VWSANDPAAHGLQLVALALSWKKPRAQASQAVLLGLSWKRPMAHSSQRVALSSAWKNPGAHACGSSVTLGHALPAPQDKHAPSPELAAYHPGLQVVQTVLALEAWNWPLPHESHWDRPPSAWNCPTAHTRHTVCPVASWK
jgi:hypothetical protein